MSHTAIETSYWIGADKYSVSVDWVDDWLAYVITRKGTNGEILGLITQNEPDWAPDYWVIHPMGWEKDLFSDEIVYVMKPEIGSGTLAHCVGMAFGYWG